LLTPPRQVMSSLLPAVPDVLSRLECSQIAQYFCNLPLPERVKTNHFNFNLPDRPPLFVKYGDGDLLAEANTQTFFYALAERDGLAPGIPAVYNTFCENGYYFLVMERVDLPTLEACNSIPKEDAVKSVAFAVGWLLAQMPAVPASLFGRISTSEACVWHAFFKDHQAPVPFVSTEALSKYINKALSRLPGKATPISLPNDLAIYHSDIREDNFLIDVATGRVWVVDFQHIGVLPKAFQQYAFFNIGHSLANDVGELLGHQEPDIVEAMSRAQGLLRQMGGDGSLGLDKFGEYQSTN